MTRLRRSRMSSALPNPDLSHPGDIIEIHDLWKIYRVGKVDVPALRGVDLTVKRGEFLAIVGPSGSGKSTLFNIIGGLTPPTTGTVRVADQDLGTLTDAGRTQLRKRTVGFVFQKFNLLPNLTAGDNIAIARAIVNRPAILLADEPTGNLDTENSKAVLEILRDLNERLGQTILMITHNPEAAAYGHQTVHMRDGRIVN